MSELDRARHTGAEADAVVGAGHVVVHRLRDRNHRHPVLMEVSAIAQGVVAADRDQVVDAEKVEVLDDVLGDVVDVVRVLFCEMRRDMLPSASGSAAF